MQLFSSLTFLVSTYQDRLNSALKCEDIPRSRNFTMKSFKRKLGQCSHSDIWALKLLAPATLPHDVGRGDAWNVWNWRRKEGRKNESPLRGQSVTVVRCRGRRWQSGNGDGWVLFNGVISM